MFLNNSEEILEERTMLKSWIKYSSYGGANLVPGSCHKITATIEGYDYNYLVDCGLFQGKIARKQPELNFNLRPYACDISAIFVTHAHIDHIGRIPAMYKWGYRNPIYATAPVVELSAIMLEDSAKIQLSDYSAMVKKELSKKYRGEEYKEVELLYELTDAIDVMDQFVPVEREKEIQVTPFLTVTFYDVGHGLGSSAIKLCFNNGEETCNLLFSGDLGNVNNPILKTPEFQYHCDIDAVFVETTYAGRFHSSQEENWGMVREEIAKTILAGGRVIVPAFAVGRTQELLYLFYEDMTSNDDYVSEIFRKTKFYVDSMLAVAATRVFMKFPEEFNSKIREMAENNKSPFYFSNLELVELKEKSIELQNNRQPCIIISAAGMCDAGRVIFHLQDAIEKPENLVVLTGYQGDGTLGRKLIDGESMVKIAKKQCHVRARILSINTLSGHADQNGIMQWLCNIEPGYELFLIHGEPEAQQEFKKFLEDVYGINVVHCPTIQVDEELQEPQVERRKKGKNNEFNRKKKVTLLEEQLHDTEGCFGCETLRNKLAKEINEVKSIRRGR